MKSLRKKLGVGIGLSSLSMIIAACGGDTTNNYTSGIDIVSKAKDLPKCTSDNEGDQVFVKENDAASVCVDGKWKALGGSSGIDTIIVSNTDTLFVSKSDTVYVSSSDTIYVSGGDVERPAETPDDSTSDSEAVIKNLKLSGFSQKGPFVNGTRVLAYELANNRTLSQTGRSYRGDIVTNDGLFNIDVVSLASQYVILEGDGYYMNEVTGEKSNGPIKLNAITDLQSRSHANINLLTHLEYFRVQELVNNGGMKLNLAKAKAEKELFAAFHITDSDDFENTEDLNIFSAGDGNAALLAISILLQRDNSVADLTSELSKLSNAFKADGSWGDLAKRAEIADWALAQDTAGLLNDFRTYVEGWDLGKTVPDFEKFIRKFYGTELGFGVCNDGVKLGTVKQVSNAKSTYYASSYTSTAEAGKDVRFICDKSLKRWRVATDIEKDTHQWTCSNGKITDEKKKQHEVGELLQGRVNADKYYTCDADTFRVANARELATNQACVSYMLGRDIVNRLSDTTDYVCGNSGWIVFKDTLKTGRDGEQDYLTVRIGTQTWMAENLSYGYRVGTSRSYCYDNSVSNCVKYGHLYTWSAAMDSAAVFSDAGKGCGFDTTCASASSASLVRGVCPESWHLPSRGEWETLFATVGGSSTAGRLLKSTSGWEDKSDSTSGNGDDSFGFSVLPAGYYNSYTPHFDYVGYAAYFWSSSEYYSHDAYSVEFGYNGEGVGVYIEDQRLTLSVRCIKD